MSRRDTIVYVHHMPDHAREAVEMTHGRIRADLDENRMLNLDFSFSSSLRHHRKAFCYPACYLKQGERRMPRRRTDEKTIREILRPRFLNPSTTQIIWSVGKARSSVNDIVRKAEREGLGWPVDLDGGRLEKILYSRPEAVREGKETRSRLRPRFSEKSDGY